MTLGPLTRPVDGTPGGRLAQALRQLIADATSADFDEDALTHAAQLVERASADLAATAPTRRAQDARSIEGYMLGNPVAGALNPISPPLSLEAVHGAKSGHPEVTGTVKYGPSFEGPPGFVHGGHVAAVLDEALGMANYVADVAALTGTLTVRYRRPTPIGRELRVEARFLERQNRKIFTWAGLYLDDELLAEADGIFISVSPEMAAKMSDSG